MKQQEDKHPLLKASGTFWDPFSKQLIKNKKLYHSFRFLSHDFQSYTDEYVTSKFTHLKFKEKNFVDQAGEFAEKIEKYSSVDNITFQYCEGVGAFLNRFSKEKCEKLKTLTLEHCSNLDELPWDMLEKLEVLELKNYRKDYHLLNIDFLTRLPNLQTLKLDCCEISPSGITTIQALNSLKGLELIFSERDDLSFIESLSGLESLYVHDMHEDKIPIKLENLTKLRELELYACNFKNLLFLKNVKLEILNLHFCDISETEFFPIQSQNLKELLLYADHPNIIRFFLPQNLNKLEKLSLFHLNQELEAEALNLSKCIELKELSLEGLNITNISYFNALSKLEKLNLTNCSITNFSSMDAPTLKEFALSDSPSPVKNISFLANLKLKKLDLEGCEQIEDFSYISTLYTLEMLKLDRCGSIAFLSTLENLKELYLTGLKGNAFSHHFKTSKEIEEFSVIQILKKLEVLELRHFKINDPSFLGSLISLKQLDLSECDINQNQFDWIIKLVDLETLAISVGEPQTLFSLLKELKNLQSLVINKKRYDGENQIKEYLDGNGGNPTIFVDSADDDSDNSFSI